MNNNSKRSINSLKDLQKEKETLRDQLAISEIKLSDNYKEILKNVQPALNIVNFFSGNKLSKKREGAAENSKGPEWGDIIKNVLMAGVSSTLFLSNSKSMFLKNVLAYGMEQGLKFITEDDLKARFKKVMERFNKTKGDTDFSAKGEDSF